MASHPTYRDNQKRRQAGTLQWQCPRCLVTKPRTREHFSPSKHRPDGMVSWCKTCAAAQAKWSRKQNPEKHRLQEKQRRERDQDKLLDRYRKRYSKHGARYRANSAEHRKRMQPFYEEARRLKRAANPEAERILRRKRYRRNIERIRAQARARWARATPQQKLRQYVSIAIRRMLKGSKQGRSWPKILGYDSMMLRRHLERQFQPGMSWDNYGTAWHVDHIVPACHFKATSPDCPELKACWRLTNLQPLWATENQQKSGRRIHLL